MEENHKTELKVCHRCRFVKWKCACMEVKPTPIRETNDAEEEFCEGFMGKILEAATQLDLDPGMVSISGNGTGK